MLTWNTHRKCLRFSRLWGPMLILVDLVTNGDPYISRVSTIIMVESRLLCLINLIIFIITEWLPVTTQKMRFSIQNFFSKCYQIHWKLRIWLHLLKKSLTENFIFCALCFIVTKIFILLKACFFIIRHFEAEGLISYFFSVEH